MSKPAAFSATYADFKLVKTRGVVQFVFEVPVEKADEALEVVGGMPNAATEQWFGIARLKPESEVVRDRPDQGSQQYKTPHAAPADKARRPFNDMSCAQQAGIMCNDPVFRRYLVETVGAANVAPDVDEAAEHVRFICNVKSRSEIDKDATAKALWRDLVEDFRGWQRALEVVG